MLMYAHVCRYVDQSDSSDENFERDLEHLPPHLRDTARMDPSQVYSRMLTYARVCLRKLTDADGNAAVHESVAGMHVCSRMLTNADGF
jgi:hypothetical protein